MLVAVGDVVNGRVGSVPAGVARCCGELRRDAALLGLVDVARTELTHGRLRVHLATLGDPLKGSEQREADEHPDLVRVR